MVVSVFCEASSRPRGSCSMNKDDLGSWLKEVMSKTFSGLELGTFAAFPFPAGSLFTCKQLPDRCGSQNIDWSWFPTEKSS